MVQTIQTSKEDLAQLVTAQATAIAQLEVDKITVLRLLNEAEVVKASLSAEVEKLTEELNPKDPEKD